MRRNLRDTLRAVHDTVIDEHPLDAEDRHLLSEWLRDVERQAQLHPPSRMTRLRRWLAALWRR